MWGELALEPAPIFPVRSLLAASAFPKAPFCWPECSPLCVPGLCRGSMVGTGCPGVCAAQMLAVWGRLLAVRGCCWWES